MTKALTSLVDDGISRAEKLRPGTASLELMGGVTQDMAFGRAELLVHATEDLSGVAFAQVQKDFRKAQAELMAGAGLRWNF